MWKENVGRRLFKTRAQRRGMVGKSKAVDCDLSSCKQHMVFHVMQRCPRRAAGAEFLNPGRDALIDRCPLRYLGRHLRGSQSPTFRRGSRP